MAINSSLMTLARCLEVLRYNQMHPGDARVIPYRESKVGARRGGPAAGAHWQHMPVLACGNQGLAAAAWFMPQCARQAA